MSVVENWVDLLMIKSLIERIVLKALGCVNAV